MSKPELRFRQDTSLKYPACLGLTQSTEPLKFMIIDRQKTARKSLMLFFTIVSDVTLKNKTKDQVYVMQGVGMVVDGRHSAFDLYWDADETVYAVDSKDNEYVCVLKE